MRILLRELDGLTASVVAVGAGIGVVWVASPAAGLALAGIAAPLGAILLVLRRRWLEVGLYPFVIGLVPLVAYRVLGPPVVEPPFPEDLIPVEILAPGAAYFLMVLGLGTTLVAGTFELRNARRRERQETSHAERKRRRLEGRTP